MSVSIQELVEELNFVAEAAHLVAEFEVASPSSVKVFNQIYEVDPTWAMGNAKRLPDRCTFDQMVLALSASHPDVKDVGPKNPERL